MVQHLNSETVKPRSETVKPRLKNIFFHLKIREGGKNINKMEVKYFYFYSDFWKNRVGSPENQKIKKIMA